jgi:hypothetical protein
MELFSLRKIRRICPRHCRPGPPAPAHGSTDFIKRWSLATGSTALIKPIKSVSLLGCLDLIWRWLPSALHSRCKSHPAPIRRLRRLASAEGGVGSCSRWLTGVRVFSSYGGLFSIRFAPTGSQWRGERVYANLNLQRAATKPGNGEAARPMLVNGEGGLLQWSFSSKDVRPGFLELPSSFSTDQLLRSAAKNLNLVAT